MNIKINATELKSLLEKVLPQVAKKAKVLSLECVLLESKDNSLTATATDFETYLSVSTSKYDNITDGKILIHSGDIKIISKLSGEIELSLISDNEIIVKAGKKSISIKNYDVSSFPETMNDIDYAEYTPILNIKENIFTNAIIKSNYFVSDNENNVMMQCYNFNIKNNRIEALDGHRVSIIDVDFTKETELDRVLIHSYINTKLKKVLSNKSDNNLQIGEYKKHFIVVKGNNFLYLQREIEGEFFRIDQFISADFDLSMTMDKKELMDIAKFNLDMLDKDNKKPIILTYNNETDNTYIYMNNGKYKTLDKLDTIDTNINKDFMIGFNPKFIYEAMKCIDDEQIKIELTNLKAPALIHATGEKYLILPVNIDRDGNTENEVKEYIKNAA